MSSSRPDPLPDSPAGVLAAARVRRAEADRAEAELLELAVGWAVMHPAESIHEAETVRLSGFGDTAIPVAGPGAPLVAEFAVAEFAAAVGLPTEAGKRYVGQAVELRYRLPRLWARVTTGDLAAWRARRVADQTIRLSREAAGFVDRHVAPVAHKVPPAQVDRLVEEAIARFMPEEAERQRRDAADGRRFDIDHQTVSFAGTSQIFGELDLADALDLDDAVGARADRLAALGCTESLDVRRALAVGELARRDLTLDLTGEEPGAAPPTARTGAGRKVVLHLHLSETAVHGAGDGADGGGLEVGRVENTRLPVTAETIREWCGRPDMQVIVKPVVDLAEHVSVHAYEVPDRIGEPVALRDLACVFPWCTRPARALRPDRHPCDRDHVIPHNRGGPTCVCSIAPLCRRHHRLKTHGRWTYYILEPGTYLWTSPHGYQFLRDHAGTLDVSRDRRPDDYRRGAPPADT